MWFVVFLRYIDDQYALMDVDLGGCQADAGGVVHGFKHIVYQSARGGGYLGHRFGLGAQARIGKFEYFKYCHGLDCSLSRQEWLKLAA
jgi:hypothetical protein